MSFLWHGLTDQGVQVPVQVDAQGRVVVAPDGGPTPGVTAAAWGLVALNGTLEAGFHIASSSRTSLGLYEVTFDAPVASTLYAVTVTPSSGGNYVIYSLNRTVNGFSVGLRISSSGAQVDGPFAFAVFTATN